MTTTHTTTVVPSPLAFDEDVFLARCSCGWESSEQDSRILAMGAADSHIAPRI